MRRTLSKALCVVAGLAASTPAHAQGTAQAGADSFYDARQMTLLVGFNPGGGYDIYGRLLAQHLPRRIAGAPSVVVRNMPGGGSLIAANHLYNVAPKDGSALGLFAGSVATDPIIGGVPAKFDARRFVWIGSGYSDVATCFSWGAGRFKTAKDLFERPMVTGSVGNSATLIFPQAMNGVLGAKLKIVKGYAGSSGLKLALEQGEIEGICGASLDSLQTSSPDWLNGGKINFLAQMTFQKTLQLADVPLITEFAANEDDKKVLQLVFAYMRMGRPLAAPPYVPAHRATILRAAFDATIKDEAFLSEAKRGGLDIDPFTGQELDDTLAELNATPKALIARAADVLSRSGD